MPTNQRFPWSSKAPPSRNLPCGVLLTSANFSIGPTPGGRGGRPHGCTGPALVGGAGAWATAGPTVASSAKAKASIQIRAPMSLVSPVSTFWRSRIPPQLGTVFVSISAVTPFYYSSGAPPRSLTTSEHPNRRLAGGRDLSLRTSAPPPQNNILATAI